MKFRNFEIRTSTSICIPVFEGHREYDLVRWTDNHSYGLIIAKLEYKPDDGTFTMTSVGLRYLEWREDGLEEFLLNWCECQRITIERGKQHEVCTSVYSDNHG